MRKNIYDIMKFINWLAKLFQDEHGNPSSKRFVGIICALSLCVTLFLPVNLQHSGTLINAVALLAFGGLGLSSVDKFTAVKKQIAEATADETEKTEN
jgi:hypothetical protein